ncbi:MAG: ribosomal protection-like ABC-F family protein [Anaerolineales bacterium]|jgi:ATP-binding cassette subfamily F protein 3
MFGTIARLDNVSQYFGGQRLFEGLRWEIHHDARVGLVGPNGAGKSTLLNLLAGALVASQGKVFVHRSVRVGYLPQEVPLGAGRTLLEEMRLASPELSKLEQEIDELAARMGVPSVYQDPQRLSRTVQLHEQALERLEQMGGLNFPGRVRSTLRGLGFEERDFDLPLQALSGGQKKLVGLAKLLLQQPNLLLLDEPDNHLDLKGKRFLEELIVGYPGAVVIVSHDRYLLDVVADEIAELEDGVLTLFSGNYSGYAFEKHQRLLSQARQFALQQREVRRLEFAIRRLGGWGAGQNEKFVRRARSMQARLDRIEQVQKPRLERRRMGLSLVAVQRGSNKAVEVAHLTKTFDQEGGRTRTVLRDLNLLVWRGERVGIIGPNGAGKTVLLHCILEQIAPTAGSVRVGPSTTLGYYDQEHLSLDPENTLADALTSANPMTDQDLYGLMGRFLFHAEEASKRIRDLSGGEKARVQMARLMLQGANCLLLDEPTNNLDIRSAEALEEALEEFEGTLLVVSHDRYFLDGLVGRIMELEDGTGHEYAGNYTAYLAEKTKSLPQEPRPDPRGTPRRSASGTRTPQEPRKRRGP